MSAAAAIEITRFISTEQRSENLNPKFVVASFATLFFLPLLFLDPDREVIGLVIGHENVYYPERQQGCELFLELIRLVADRPL